MRIGVERERERLVEDYGDGENGDNDNVDYDYYYD